MVTEPWKSDDPIASKPNIKAIPNLVGFPNCVTILRFYGNVVPGLGVGSLYKKIFILNLSENGFYIFS